jgi:hypothetical protein
MDQYSTTGREPSGVSWVRREAAATVYSSITVVGQDGLEISGAERRLLNVRAGQIAWFLHAGAAGGQFVFFTTSVRARSGFDQKATLNVGESSGQPSLLEVAVRLGLALRVTASQFDSARRSLEIEEVYATECGDCLVRC